MLQRCQRLLVRAGMFDNLSQRLDKAWDMVRKDGKLTADNIKEPMREIRRALLEADVRPFQAPHKIHLRPSSPAHLPDVTADSHDVLRPSRAPMDNMPKC